MIYIAGYCPREAQSKYRTEHELGRLLLRAGLAKEYGREWETEVGPMGRPFLKDAPHIDFNISHTRGLVACAIHNGRVGLDVQEIRSASHALRRRTLAESEQELAAQAEETGGEQAAAEMFTRLWTLKEAFIKATGQGLSADLREIVFWPGEDENSWNSNQAGWHFCQTRLYRKYIISVCVSESDDFV